MVRLCQEMLQTMWLDLANLFNSLEISIANSFQVNSVTPLGLWIPVVVPLQSQKYQHLEKVQRVFTKHINGMHDLSYTERLKALQIYSLQRRRDRYMAIYIYGRF